MIVVAAFLACLGGFVVIGLLSARGRQATSEDYLVASRDVSPWLTALSSAATNNSGFMFIGLFGFAYRFGVQAVWLQAGWIAGDVIAWLWVHQRVRAHSGRLGATSVPQLVATDHVGRVARPVLILAGVLTFFFLGGYAAAQLRAGSAALTGLFGWATWIGVLLGAVIVVVYCMAGGLRASIWTDAAQALVMLAALLALLLYAVAEVGGPATMMAELERADPALVAWFPDGLAFGMAAYLLGFVAGGLGAIGQPHILIRSMAICDDRAIPRAAKIYFLWYIPFSIAAVAAALYARVIVPDLITGLSAEQAAGAAEAALPALATHLLPQVLLGVLLAGVFAATMSTADSQILACSAAVTQDLFPSYRRSYLAGKLATLAVAALAVAIALTADQNVFRLVLGAWSALGASIGPLLVLRIFGARVPGLVAFLMMITGVVTVQLWARGPWAGDIFELLPGMAAPLLLYGGYALLPWPRARV